MYSVWGCARRDYFSPLSSSCLQRGKIVPSRVRAQGVHGERIPDLLHAPARPDLTVIIYIVKVRCDRGVKVCSGGVSKSESEFEGSEMPGTRSEVNAI